MPHHPACLFIISTAPRPMTTPYPQTFFLELTSLSSQHREGEMGMDMGKS